MRLLNVSTLRLEKFFDEDRPSRYAILSHTWGPEEEEIIFEAVESGTIDKTKKGFFKLQKCCEQAKKDGCDYAWVDTCCIRSSDFTELGKSINSMFRWYKEATICYGYLADVPAGTNCNDPEGSFFRSRWFKRGWTLQELLAPETMQFYDMEWNAIGTRDELSSAIEKITRIPRPVLQGWQGLHETSVAQRMSWAANRSTKEREDIAYCLLGLFGVNMSLIYGEGPESAFARLQEEIMKKVRDDSILAWGYQPFPQPEQSVGSSTLSAGALARSPSDFKNCDKIVSKQQYAGPVHSLELRGGYLSVQLPLHEIDGETYAILGCCPDDQPNVCLAVPLRADPSKPSSASEYWFRPKNRDVEDVIEETGPLDSQLIYIQAERSMDAAGPLNRRHWFRIGELAGGKLEVKDVHPRPSWQEKQGVISTFKDPSEVGKLGRIVRLGFTANRDRHLLLLLWVERSDKEKTRAWCNVLTCRTDLEIDEFLGKMKHFRPELFTEESAKSAGGFTVRMTEMMVAGHPMFVFDLHPSRASADEFGFDLDTELSKTALYGDFVETLRKEDTLKGETEKFEEKLLTLREDVNDKELRLAAVKDEIQKLIDEKSNLETKIGEAKQALSGFEDENKLAITALDSVTKTKTGQIQALRQLLEEDDTNEASIGLTALELVATFLLQNRQSGLETAFAEIKGRQGELISQSMSGADRHAEKLVIRQCERELEQTLSKEKPILRSVKLLHLAAIKGFRAIAELHVGYVAPRDDGSTPPASTRPSSIATIRQPVPSGSELEGVALLSRVDDALPDGRTPLSYAAERGRPDIVEVLLRAGSIRNDRDKAGRTPLSHAAEKGHIDVFRQLLDAGANVDIADDSGRTPVSYAAEEGHVQVIEALIAHDCNISKADAKLQTPLHHAMYAKTINPRVIELLLLAGAPTKARDLKAKTPLAIALDLRDKEPAVFGMFRDQQAKDALRTAQRKPAEIDTTAHATSKPAKASLGRKLFGKK
jgi:hypothetical protein